MKTWLNREGEHVSEKPKEYFVGKDAHGNDVFIGDICRSKDSKRLFKVLEGDYFTTPFYISNSVLIPK